MNVVLASDDGLAPANWRGARRSLGILSSEIFLHFGLQFPPTLPALSGSVGF